MASSLVWEKLGWTSSLVALPCQDTASWLLAAWDLILSTQHSLFATVLWSFWNACNVVLFDYVVLPREQIIFCVKNYDAKF